MNHSNVESPGDQNPLPTAVLTPEERYSRIAEAAYLRAAARGFAGGDPIQDWLDAEADLMNVLNQDPATRESNEQCVSNKQELMR